LRHLIFQEPDRMRLAFFCSCLEPGRDGVGDYTRRLAAECIRQGHASVAVALNDGQVSQPVFESQSVEDISLLVLRLPAGFSWDARIAEARKWVEAFRPDWMSLQFVPFGYHPKGLCFGLAKKLSRIQPQAAWQIMFHELWLGLGANSSFKHRLWGALQRSIVCGLVHRLRPRIVHTQADPYQQALQRQNISASILPLFGNITPVPGDAWDTVLAGMVPDVPGEGRKRDRVYLAGIFGAIHPEWSAEKTVDVLLPLVQRAGRRLVLVFFGKSNLTAEAGERLERTLGGQVVVVALGEKSGAEISRILQTLDLGLATSPYQVIQKSGTVAAMLEHGLQVLVTRDDWHLAGVGSRPLAKSPRLLLPDQFARLGVLPVRDPEIPADRGARGVAAKMTSAMRVQSPAFTPVLA
jgi:hypothetical protein